MQILTFLNVTVLRTCTFLIINHDYLVNFAEVLFLVSLEANKVTALKETFRCWMIYFSKFINSGISTQHNTWELTSMFSYLSEVLIDVITPSLQCAKTLKDFLKYMYAPFYIHCKLSFNLCQICLFNQDQRTSKQGYRLIPAQKCMLMWINVSSLLVLSVPKLFSSTNILCMYKKTFHLK